MGLNKYLHSRYWLGHDADNLDLSDRGTDTGHILQLTAIKQSITNFVRILTNDPTIPVTYSSGEKSYTDGKQVVLSASTKEKNLDAVVGLALHEGSHIKLTDFDFLKGFRKYGTRMIPAALQTTANTKLQMLPLVLKRHIKFLMNVIEDRRIDYFIYSTAPGYRPYYEAMYDYYFRNKQIDLAIQKGIKRDPTVDNYIFYIVNVANRWFDTRHLKGLSRIYALLDLDHIDRLNDDTAAYNYVREQVAIDAHVYEFDRMPRVFQLACQIMEIILQHAVPTPQQGQQPGQPQPQQGSPNPTKENNCDPPEEGGQGAPMSGDPDPEDTDTNDGTDASDDATGDDDDKTDNDKDETGTGDGKGATSADDPTGNDEVDATDGQPRQPKHAPQSNPKDTVNDAKLEKAIKDQKDFLEGKVKKTRITKETDDQVRAMEHAGASVTDVEHARQYGGRTKTRVLILRSLTKAFMESGAYPFTNGHQSSRYRTSTTTIALYPNASSEAAVKAGLQAGAILAQRLAIRNQTQIMKFNRKPEGHLDKRRLHALGYDDRSVFFHLRETAFAPVFVHLTLDGSGSMHGDRWEKALTVGVALAVAAEKIENLNVVLSVRAGVDDFATISILYDSRVDTTQKIKALFPFLTTNGSTPEGLAFAAILDEITQVKATDRYFINLSDGEPCWSDYGGEPAYAHTREQVNLIRNEGVKVLSYFVGEGGHGSSRSGGSAQAFSIMYGKDAAFIDVRQVPSLITTLNRLFLQR